MQSVQSPTKVTNGMLESAGNGFALVLSVRDFRVIKRRPETQNLPYESFDLALDLRGFEIMRKSIPQRVQLLYGVERFVDRRRARQEGLKEAYPLMEGESACCEGIGVGQETRDKAVDHLLDQEMALENYQR
jgi:hypothetical protein